MKAIYTPTGKAKEYSNLACNLYTGCSVGCKYCYAPSIMRMTREEFRTQARPRFQIIQQLEKDLITLKRQENTETPVLFCFTCDPYQPALDTEHHLMRQALQLMHKHRIPVSILTKREEAVKDFDLLAVCKYPEFGMTLTFSSDTDTKNWEPGSSLPGKRLETLYTAKTTYGIKTWASLEPIIDVKQTLDLIEASHTFVDMFKVGKWNHSPQADTLDWVDIRRRVVGALEDHGCRYLLKKDLKWAR
jgi:DNA repair photolyase